VERLVTGLWRWTAPHPGWKPGDSWDQEVACVAVQDGDTLLLIDPLAPPAGSPEEAAFWRWLEGARAVQVLLGNRFHERSAPEIVGRVGARVGGEAPPGVKVHAVDGLGGEERAFYLREHQTLVFADAVLGTGDGGLKVAPRSWSEEPARYDLRFRASLLPLLALRVERVLPAHGAPALRDGGRALAAALDA
jgi:hypothetical protein